VFARKWGEAVLGLEGVGLSRLMWNREIVVDMTVAVRLCLLWWVLVVSLKWHLVVVIVVVGRIVCRWWSWKMLW
jgi:hypothetical protein